MRSLFVLNVDGGLTMAPATQIYWKSIRPARGTAATDTMPEGWPATHTWQADGDGGAFVRHTGDRDRSTVFLDDLFHGGKSQADPRPFGGEKRLENLVHEVGRDRNAVVLDQDLNLHAFSRSMLGDLDIEMTARRHGLTGVFEYAQENLL